MGSLKKGAFVSYLWVIVHIMVNFLYVPLLIGVLGKAEYGLYQLVGSFFAYVNVIEASMASGTLRFYCEAKAHKDEVRIQRVLYTCRAIYRILAGLIIVIGAGCIIVFSRFYESSMTEMELLESCGILILLFVNLLFTMLNSVYLSVLNGNEKFVFVKGVSIVSQIMQPVVCMLIVRKCPYAIVIAGVHMVANLIVCLVRYQYVTQNMMIRIERNGIDRRLVNSILVFVGGILLAQIADQIFWKTDQVILGKFYNTSVVAIYSIGVQIYTNYMYAGITVAQVFFPRVSRYVNEGQAGESKVSAEFVKVGRIAFQICLLVLVIFFVVGREFLTLWVGNGFEKAYTVALIVMIPFTIDIAQHIALLILQAKGLYGFRAKIYFVSAGLNVLLTIVMVKWLGMVGAAIATAISIAVTSGLIMNIYYAKKIGLNISRFWRETLTITLKHIPLLLVLLAVNHTIVSAESIIAFATKIVLYTTTIILFDYVAVMNSYEKSMITFVLQKVLKIRNRDS